MTIDKYHPRNHPLDCAYHVDQYPHECTCGVLGDKSDEIITHLTCEIIQPDDDAKPATGAAFKRIITKFPRTMEALREMEKPASRNTSRGVSA